MSKQDYNQNEKEWEEYNQHGLNIDMANTLVTIQDVLETHQEMIQLLAKYIGMPIEDLEEE